MNLEHGYWINFNVWIELGLYRPLSKVEGRLRQTVFRKLSHVWFKKKKKKMTRSAFIGGPIDSPVKAPTIEAPPKLAYSPNRRERLSQAAQKRRSK